MKLIVFIFLFVASGCFNIVYAAKTYISTETIDLSSAPGASVIEQWPSRTLFTSSEESVDWIKVTGHFPEGEWQPLSTPLYVIKSTKVVERAAQSENAPKTFVYKTLESSGSKAKAYRLKQRAIAFKDKQAAVAMAESNVGSDDLIETIEVAETEDSPANVISLAPGYTFTSGYEDDIVVKVTGHFPEGHWQPLDTPMWLAKPILLQNRTQPRLYRRDPDARRFVVIDKAEFNLTLYEALGDNVTKVMKTPVALGYDRCLPESKGGKCYYTPEGVFEIEFKLFDPDGINWCIPKKMEGEFASKIASGDRCWRGVMGNHAMHFGQSLFLHGTSNPNSIGSRSTHGCVRLRNVDISMLYRALQTGDKVIITEQPESLDLVTLISSDDEAKRSEPPEDPQPLDIKTLPKPSKGGVLPGKKEDS